MNPQLAAALAQAKQTNQAVPVNMGTYTLMAYPNGQVGPQGGGGTARWTPQTPQIPTQPVQPSNPFNAAGVQGLPGGPSGAAVTPQPSWWQQLFTPPHGTPPGPGVPSQDEQSAGTGLPLTGTPAPAPVSAAPVDRHDDPVAAQARVYRINHGISTPDDSAATDALNAESLAAERSGRTYLNRDLAAQYGQAPAAGTVGPRTDVVNALLMPPSTTGTAYAQQQPATQSPYARQQPIVLAPTTTAPQQPYPLTYTGGVPTNLTAPASSGGAMPTVSANLLDPRVQANSLLAQGIY